MLEEAGDYLSATIVLVDRDWFAVPLPPSDYCRIELHKDDPWDFDISAGLIVQMRRTKGYWRIVSRKGNKKFVRIGNQNS